MKVGPLDLPVSNVNQLATLVVIIALAVYALKQIPSTGPLARFKVA